MKKQIATPWTERVPGEQLLRREKEKRELGPFEIRVSPSRLRKTRRPIQRVASVNKQKIQRYGRANSMLANKFTLSNSELRKMLPHSIKERSSSDCVLATLSKPISNTISLPSLERKINKPAASINTEKKPTSRLPSSPSFSHQSHSIVGFFQRRRETQTKQLRMSEMAIRNRMLYHRYCEIDMKRAAIRDGLPFEKILRFSKPASKILKDGGEEQEEAEAEVNTSTTTSKSFAERKRRSMLYDYLPGSSKLVKKSLYSRNYKLQEYWRQLSVQRANGVGSRVTTAESIVQTPVRDRLGRRRSLSRISEIESRQQRARLMSSKSSDAEVSPLAVKFGGIEGTEKAQGVYGVAGETISQTVGRILKSNNLLDLMLLVIWRGLQAKLRQGFERFRSNVRLSRLSDIIGRIQNYSAKRAFDKWRVVDDHMKRIRKRKIQRALSISQAMSPEWQRTLIKQLVLKKFFFTVETVNYRSAFERWKDVLDLSGKRQRNDILTQVSQRSSQDFHKHRAPRSMLHGIHNAKNEKAVIKFESGTVDELMALSRGVHKKSRLKSTITKLPRLPSKAYFFEICKNRDKSLRSRNVTASELNDLTARKWY